jgi:maltose O-acetyltransferase
MISTATHPLSALTRRVQGGCHAFPVEIGDDTWICARATINPGVKIGQGCLVAAGSVVAKDVEAGMLVGGVPAKVLRKLEDGEVEKAASELI